MQTDKTPATEVAQDQTAAQESDVDALAPPDSVEVTVNGKPFQIRPMKVRQVFPFLKAARPLFAALVTRTPAPVLPPNEGGQAQGGDVSPEDLTGPAIASAMNDAQWLLETLSNDGEGAIKALAIGCDIPEADLGEMEVVGLVVLLKHFVKVNASFFAAQGLTLPQALPFGLATQASDAASAASQPKR